MAMQDDFSKALTTLPGMVQPGAGSAVRRLVAVALDGTIGVPGAKAVAGKAYERRGDLEAAITNLVNQHVGFAGAQGFVTNLGGILTTLVALPANMAAIVTIQARMVGCIAHLRGYDVDDRRVRTAITMCLLGEEAMGRRLGTGDLPTSALAIATAPVFDASLEQRVAERVAAELFMQVSGKRLTLLLGRRVPVVGGAVGAGVDGWSTYQVARLAKQQLPRRRPER